MNSLQRQKVDVERLDDVSIVYTKSNLLDSKNKQFQTTILNSKSDLDQDELRELKKKVYESNQQIQNLQYRVETSEKKLSEKDQLILEQEK